MFPHQSVHQRRHHLQQSRLSSGQCWLAATEPSHLGNQPILDEQNPEPELVGPEEIPPEQSVGQGEEGEQSLHRPREAEVETRRGPTGSSLEDGETGRPLGCQGRDGLHC